MIDILIPTFNRSKFLIKNLRNITDIIETNGLKNDINVIVSNNNSSDDTADQLSWFKIQNADNINMSYFNQKENIGAEKNILFLVGKSSSKYYMFLGDDDYFDSNYMLEVVKIIRKFKNIMAIVPNFISVDTKFNVLSKSRDAKKKSSIYEKSFTSILRLSWRGHQLSGIVLKNSNQLELYSLSEIKSLYPQLFLLTFSLKQGLAFHLVDYPIKVMQPGQENKYWSYGNDGLIFDFLVNYKRMKNIGYLVKFLLQLRILDIQNWRYISYFKTNKKQFYRIIIKMFFSNNTLLLTKLFFPMVLIHVFCRKLLFKVKRSGGLATLF